MIEKVVLKNNEMRYFKFGNGSKIMVMIPGLNIKSVMESETIIIDMYKMFINDYTIYCFDRVTYPKEGYTIKDMAIDTLEAIKILNLKDIYLFGTSQGGMISLTMAYLNETLFKKIIVASTTVKVDDQLNGYISKFIDLAEYNKIEELVLYFSKLIYPKEIYLKFEPDLIALAKTITKEELSNFIIFSNTILDFNIFDFIEKINVPIRIFHDKTDELISIDLFNELINTYKYKKNITSYIYDGFGHTVYDMAPDFKDKILEYYNK